MDNHLPFVSMMVPCRNGEKCIGKCLDSIISNDYLKENLEVLFINSFTEQGIVASLTDKFGVGNSYFGVQTNGPKWVDTAFGRCYRREVFHSTCNQSFWRVIRASVGSRNLVSTEHHKTLEKRNVTSQL